MEKSFEKDILDEHFKQNQKIDPYVFVTPEVTEFMQMINTAMTSKFIMSYLASNVILAPLQTIITSLQLSVKKHKELYLSEQAKTKQLAKLNTEMTVHEKRKFQLMIRAGGKTIPYTAPVYGGYKQTIQGLKNQGWKAFFKGLAFRSITTVVSFLPFTQYSLLISDQDIKKGLMYQNLKLYASCMLLDLFMNPLYMQENRMILQNRIPEFQSFNKPFKSIGKAMNKGQASRALSFHFFNSTVGLFARYPAYFSMITGQGLSPLLAGIFLAGQFAIYPFSTAYRRIQCQTQRYIGMIPVRYSGFFHALRVIIYEEGPKGLWRAFPLHAGQTVIRLALLQIFNQPYLKRQ